MEQQHYPGSAEQATKTTRTITQEGDKKIETTITKEGNKTITHIITTKNGEKFDEEDQIYLNPDEYYIDSKESDLIDFPISELIIESERIDNRNNENQGKELKKKLFVEELETDVKEEETNSKKIIRLAGQKYDDDYEENSILYDSNSQIESELEEEKIISNRINNVNININDNIKDNIRQNININEKYFPYEYSEIMRNDITKEEIINLSAKLIQSAFRGYLLRKIFYTNMQVYLNYSWSFSLLEGILRRKIYRSFYYEFKRVVFQKKNTYMKNLLNININSLPKIFVKKRYILLTDLKKIRTESFSFINQKKSNVTKKTIKEYNKKKTNESISKNLIISNEELQIEILKLKNENAKLKEENEDFKIKIENLNETSNILINSYRDIKIKYIFRDEDGNVVEENDENIREKPKNLVDVFKKLEKELKDSNEYIEKIKKENKQFDDKIDNILSEMKEIIKNQNEISKGNKNKKEIEIDNKLNEISKILNEISNGKKDKNIKEDNKIKEEKIKDEENDDDDIDNLKEEEIKSLKEEINKLKEDNEKLKKMLKEQNPLIGSNLTFGKKSSKEDIEKKIDEFLSKSKSFYENKNLSESKDFNNQSITFQNIYELIQSSKDKLEDSKQEINELKKENENLKNNLRESFIETKKEDKKDINKKDSIQLENENEDLKNKLNIIIEEKNKEIEQLREQCKKALSLSDKNQKNKLLKELEQDAINKSKNERKLLQEISSQRRNIPFEEINEVKKENVKLKEQIKELQNEINLLNKKAQLRSNENNNNKKEDLKDDKDKNNENLQNEINELKKSCEILKTELHQEKEFTDKFKEEKNTLNKKMRETILRQLLINSMRKEEKTLKYNFNHFSRVCLESSLKKKYSLLSKEKLKEVYLKNILQNIEKDKKYYLRKNFMKFYTNGIVREMNMSNSQKKALEKRRSQWKIKYEKEQLAKELEEKNPEEAKKLREEIKKMEEEEKEKEKKLINSTIISPDLSEEEKKELAKKKYLKDLFNKKIKEKQHYIHDKFTKFYYKGLLFKMKYGDKMSDKFPEIKNIEKPKVEEKKSETEIDTEILSPQQKLEEQRKKARDLRKQLRDKKDEEKREKEKTEIDIENEDQEILDKKTKTNKGKDNTSNISDNEINEETDEKVKMLKIEKLLSKFIYRIERANYASMRSDIIRWNYKTKLLKVKDMKLVKKKKRRRKKIIKKIRKIRKI